MALKVVIWKMCTSLQILPCKAMALLFKCCNSLFTGIEREISCPKTNAGRMTLRTSRG